MIGILLLVVFAFVGITDIAVILYDSLKKKKGGKLDD